MSEEFESRALLGYLLPHLRNLNFRPISVHSRNGPFLAYAWELGLPLKKFKKLKNRGRGQGAQKAPFWALRAPVARPYMPDMPI